MMSSRPAFFNTLYPTGALNTLPSPQAGFPNPFQAASFPGYAPMGAWHMPGQFNGQFGGQYYTRYTLDGGVARVPASALPYGNTNSAGFGPGVIWYSALRGGPVPYPQQPHYPWPVPAWCPPWGRPGPAGPQGPQGPAGPAGDSQKLGSVGLYGDPYLSLQTEGLQVPAAMQNIHFGIDAGQTLTLLSDPDEGGLTVNATGVALDDSETPETAINLLEIALGDDRVQFNAATGQLVLNGDVLGSITESLDETAVGDSGAIVKIDESPDGGAGQTTRRMVFASGQYVITAAVRAAESADAQAASATPAYLDLNIEEVVADAANNATGAKTPLEGVNNPVTGAPVRLSMADMLAMEQGNALLQWFAYS
ncbi:MAG: hypothetical protein VKJ06_02970 [Vampirovibrionales bacterium]|nr:hypothetical protein [Vampirovibrionales bacterium]